jgi:hypothetical protein
VEFDAYEVSSATQTVPNNVTAKQGGSSYNNSLIPAGYTYTTENDSAAVRTKVTTYAGRYWGGDFEYTITATNTSIDNTLKTRLQNYASGLIKAGTAGNASCPITSPSSSSTLSSSSVMPSSSSVIPSSSSGGNPPVCAGTEKFWNFSDPIFTSALPESIEESYTIDGLTIVHGSSDMGYTENTKTIDGHSFDHRFQFGGTGSIENRALKFNVTGECSITVYGMSGNSSEIRTLALSNGTTELQAIDFPGNTISRGVYSYTGTATSLYLYSKKSGINVYGIKVNLCDEGTPILLPIPSHSNVLNAMRNAVALQVASETSVKVFDLKGNVVRTLNFKQGSYTVSLGDLSQGLYIVRAKNASWQKTVKINVIANN